MPLSNLLNRTVSITRRSPSATKDDYGNVIPTTAITTTVGELQQRAAVEPGTHDDLSGTQWLLILPAGTGIDTNDKVTVDGETFEVFGAPWPARNPRTRTESHVEVNLRRVAAAVDA